MSAELLDRLTSIEVALEAKLDALASARAESDEGARRIDEHLLADNARLRTALVTAEQSLSELSALVDRLTATPLLPAVVLAHEGSMALVTHGDARRVVRVAEGVDDLSLAVGQEVLLASNGNAIVGPCPFPVWSGGETAAFERYLGSRLVVRCRDDEFVVDPVGEAAKVDWKPGDLVRWERSLWIAAERVPRPDGATLWLEQSPRETFADIGGLDEQIEVIRSALRLDIERPDIARKYGVHRVGCILLFGPPGTGKTLLARAIANWLGTLAGDRASRFIHVRPAEFASMWYGETERKWRECFRVAREAADRDPGLPVIIFLDEVDSVAARRGRSLTAVDDRIVCAVAEELNGIRERRNVCVIAATNRPDVLDPALTRPGGRFGDLPLAIPRPNRAAASQILTRHLPADLPCCVPGASGDRARQLLVDVVLSGVYAPNALGESARITFRDGSVRGVHPRELVSGASLAKIVRSAVHAAAAREAAGAGEGVRCEDLVTATAEEIERSASLLTAANVRSYLPDVPEDQDVVSVTPVRRNVRRAHRYVQVA